MSAHRDSIIAEFLAETEEALGLVAAALANALQAGLGDEVLRRIARDIHTLKGSAQLFGFSLTARLAHAMEDALGRFNGQSPDEKTKSIDHLFTALEVLSRILSGIKLQSAEPAIEAEVKTIEQALASRAAGQPPSPPQSAVNSAPPQVSPAASLSASAASAAELPPPPLSAPALSTPPTAPPVVAAAVAASPAPPPERSEEAHHDSTIRVHVDLLDNLMNLVGELVLVRNQLQQHGRDAHDDVLGQIDQRLSVVTSELQADVMKTRMQPIGGILGKFHRVVRDMSRSLGKQVELKLDGTETELDKTLIEAVRDPLTHIVRNAIDHGLETPDERRAAGKTATGTVLIRSVHESGHVLVEIKDDGRGLDRSRIGAKAIERGLVSAEALSRMSDREVFNFIFLPGFSTADKVSSLSGRGVGMDVVRTNIEAIGGTVELMSRPGQGTTLHLKIPLTLAIIPALLVRAGSERFAIPQVKLAELLRVGGEGAGDEGNRIEFLQGRPVYRLRGHLLPLVSLGHVLGLSAGDGKDHDQFPPARDGTYQIAVLNADKLQFGVVVDEIEDSVDVVVKPLPAFVKDLSVYSGATIMGDGSVALTLEVSGLAERSGFSCGENGATAQSFAMEEASQAAPDKILGKRSDEIDYLTVALSSAGRYAIPLCFVSRLEEFRPEDLQLAGDQRVVKYRDSLLPIISVNASLGFGDSKRQSDRVSVVVVKKGERQYGLEVDGIVDVLTSHADIDLAMSDRPGLLGSLIEGSEIITMIDPLAIAHPHDADGRSARDRQLTTAGGLNRANRQGKRLLLVEDGNFFRRHVGQLLEEAGYTVATAADGAEGLKLVRDVGEDSFAAIVSDIEMPIMGGLEFARQVRSRGANRRVPMIALSSRFSDEDVQRGIDSGFDRYIEKLNPTQLLDTIDLAVGVAKGA